MIRWLRMVLPLEYVVLFLFVYAALSSIIWLFVITSPSGEPPFFFLFLRFFMTAVVALVYGVYRGGSFHPFDNDAYLKFLKQVPWTPEKPLPLGPVHLVWQDVLVFLTLVCLLWTDNITILSRLFLCGMLTFQLRISILLLRMRMWNYFFAVLFGLGGVMLLLTTPTLAAILALGMYVVCYYGLKRSLVVMHHLDAEDIPRFSAISISLNINSRNAAQQSQSPLTGWPFDMLAAPQKHSVFMLKSESFGISALHGWLFSLLAGWLVFSFSILVLDVNEHKHQFQQGPSPVIFNPELNWTPKVINILPRHTVVTNDRFVTGTTWFLYLFLNSCLCVVLVAGRLSAYISGHFPPISLWGRIRTWRWIIPNYDTVFVSPLIILLCLSAYPLLVIALGLPPFVIGPLITSAMVLATLNIGPNRLKWMLTSSCKLVRTGYHTNNRFDMFEEI